MSYLEPIAVPDNDDVIDENTLAVFNEIRDESISREGKIDYIYDMMVKLEPVLDILPEIAEKVPEIMEKIDPVIDGIKRSPVLRMIGVSL